LTFCEAGIIVLKNLVHEAVFYKINQDIFFDK